MHSELRPTFFLLGNINRRKIRKIKFGREILIVFALVFFSFYLSVVILLSFSVSFFVISNIIICSISVNDEI